MAGGTGPVLGRGAGGPILYPVLCCLVCLHSTSCPPEVPSLLHTFIILPTEYLLEDWRSRESLSISANLSPECKPVGVAPSLTSTSHRCLYAGRRRQPASE